MFFVRGFATPLGVATPLLVFPSRQDNDQPPVGLNNLCLDAMLHDEVTNGVNVWFGCQDETENI
ncbi:hypothetical protein AB1E84_002416 [Yersinia enterocolitica]|uniref:hypothetical protein n=1 Tax=Yersinia enterocolitica TaxID=630 RepID=UPI003D08E949|nr:hypothetical protein [Yersinia enterocolitica]